MALQADSLLRGRPLLRRLKQPQAPITVLPPPEVMSIKKQIGIGIDTNRNRRIDPDEYATYKALIASRVASREASAGNTPPPAGNTPPPAGTQQPPAGNWPPFDINNTTSPWFTIDLGQTGGSTTIPNNNYIDPSNTPPAETQTPPPAETQTPPPATTQVATGSDYGITGPGGYQYKEADWNRFTSQGGIDSNENRRIDPDEYAAYTALIASRQASAGNTPPPATGGTPPPATGGTPPPATGGTPPPAGNDPANPYNHSPEVVAALIAGGIDPATFNPADIDIGNIGLARGGHVGLGSMFARGGHVGAGNLGRRPASNLQRMLDQLDLRRA